MGNGTKKWKCIQGISKKLNEQQKDGLPKVKMFTLPNGLGQLTDCIGNNLSDKLHLNTKVEKIENTNSVFRIYTNKGVFECEEVICTLPANVTSTLIKDSSLVEKLQDLEYVPIDVFHFGFDKKHVKNQVAGFGLLTKKNDKKSFLGILFNSSIFNQLAPKGFELFTVLVGGQRNRNLCKLEPKLLQEIILNELNQLINHSGPVYMSNHYRWKKGIPQYNLKYDYIEDHIKSFLDKNTNFYINSNFYRGISVSDCISKSEFISKKINRN